jgi:hypothetical protein
VGVPGRVVGKKDRAWLLHPLNWFCYDISTRQAAEIGNDVETEILRKRGSLMRTKGLVLVAVVFCLSLWFRADAYAQLGSACDDDIARFCNGVQPGGGRLAKCLKNHEKELSPACKESVVAAQKRLNEAAESCHDDVLKFCKDVEPGGGRIANCLREHQNELSADCRERWLKQRRK